MIVLLLAAIDVQSAGVSANTARSSDSEPTTAHTVDIQAVNCPTNSTGFEFNDITGEFVLGDSPTSVTFTGGEAKSIGNLNLYHSGLSSWMIGDGNTGTITFETPAIEVNFFFRDEGSTVQSVLTILDTEGGEITSINGINTDWTEVNILILDGMPLIESIKLQNNDTSTFVRHAVIDDLDFCVGPIPLEDPIPNTIGQGPITVGLETLATGLTAPNWGTHAPGDDNRLFVTDQDGILWAINLVTGDKKVFLDVRDRIVALGIAGPNTFDERGLLGVAFHPNYVNNGLIYTYTSEPVSGEADFTTLPAGETANHQSVIAEWQVPNTADPDSAVDPASVRVLLTVDQPQFNHDGGAINFAGDSFLYISLGDGGSGDDQGTGHGESGNGQNPGNVLGTILRINPLGTNSANGQYGVPSDNPFIGQEGFAEEIFAYGFRNPFRFSFDMDTDEMYVADVGQNDIEEVSLGFAGGNYGWNHKEGSFFFHPNGEDAGFVTDVDPGVPAGLIDPIAEYDHDEGIAVIGGFVYRGSGIPALYGSYVFGDFTRAFGANDGRIFHLTEDEIVEFPLAGQDDLGLSLLGFGQDSQGEVYVLANGTGVPFGDTGVVLKIVVNDLGACGDLNEDGTVDVFDTITILHIIVGNIAPTSTQQILADVDRDGSITVFDAIMILQHIVGKIEITMCGLSAA